METFFSFDNAMFAKDKKNIYAYGQAIKNADINTWELIYEYYSKDDKHIFYVNREIKGADLNSFETVQSGYSGCWNLAKDKFHFYRNDEIVNKEDYLDYLNDNKKFLMNSSNRYKV